ncbi:MAG: helix-hairpin-helix domain-containing protein [Bacteroidales bacterium]|nr:helix-hairpin-helix domain-containing protein [Bacteroidales bacterium]
MRGFIKEYFNFSKRERNGIIVLLLILAIIVSIRITVNNTKHNKRIDFTEFEKDIDKFIAYQTPDFSKKPSSFDPNTADADQLLCLGLSPRSVNGILQYREKEWKFYKPEDMLRVKDLTEEEFEHVKEFIHIPKKSYSKDYKYQYPKKDYVVKETELFYFDPNTASKEELLSLGFLDWQSNNIIKYRNSGGVFSEAKDIEKIYGLDPAFVDKLKPYVQIDSTFTKKINLSNKDISININSSTALEMQKISGIGPSYSKRIVEYRDKLGGFIKLEQIMEVYGFTDELYESVKNSFIIDTSNIKKININTAKYVDLIKHPYIDKETTNSIINYRKFAGEIKSFEELVTQKAISKEVFDKLQPYIKTK